jgi:hypothetical protein
MKRVPHFHAGVPPLTNCYAKQLWKAIQLGVDCGERRFVYLDWKQHWRVSDERPNCDHWEVNSRADVVHVSVED